MQQKAGAQIGAKAFLQSLFILLLLILLAGVLTQVIPSGRYARLSEGGRELIDPASFQYISKPDYPFWRWFTAPVEVLWGRDAVIIITIIVFILLVGGAFAVLEACGILKAAITRIVAAFGGHKYLLLLVMALFFMLMGAFFGLFEEVVPLVPLMIALSYYMGWDALVGLGMSIFATNLGFSAAITNPFTIGVAQKLAGLPLFSGAWLRIPIFLVIYAILAFFLLRYAKKIDRNPQASLVYAEDEEERSKYRQVNLEGEGARLQLGRAMIWFAAFLILVIAVLFGSSFVSYLSDFALPLVGVLFFIGGLGAGLLSGVTSRQVFKALGEGVSGIAPGIPLILMAASVKHIVTQGAVMDTILYQASAWLQNTEPAMAALLIFAIALGIEFFIASAGAKAVLMMPILLPLADLIGVTRQVTVTAYCFGDGFSNLAYPTNPVLLIVLGLAGVSYTKWLRWTLPLWGVILIVVVAFLWLAVTIHYGPF